MRSSHALAICRWRGLLALFLFSLGTGAPAADVVDAEAWFDDTALTPGTGTAVSLDGTGPIFRVADQLDIGSLADGVHTLFVRTFDGSEWSAPLGQVFVKSPQPPVGSDNHILAAEYFFDGDDQGPGNNAAIAVQADSGTAVNLAEKVEALASIAGLSPGLHRLSIRVRDKTGNWSLPIVQSFVRAQSLTSPNAIVAAEYFLGDDPGAGNATPLSTSPGDIVKTIAQTLADSATPAGHYRVGFRARDTDGRWSATRWLRYIVPIDAPDADQDFVADAVDAFANNPAAAVDSDGDGKPDDWLDTCVLGCRETSGLVVDEDDDNDGVPDVSDAFPLDDTESVDSDGDGIGDNADNCPTQANADQRDRDGDSIGDACDPYNDESLCIPLKKADGTFVILCI